MYIYIYLKFVTHEGKNGKSMPRISFSIILIYLRKRQAHHESTFRIILTIFFLIVNTFSHTSTKNIS